MARARCVVAEAEIAFVSRDLGWPAAALEAARAVLERHGDRANAAHARYLGLRRLLLLGASDEAERAVAGLDPAPVASGVARPVHELVAGGDRPAAAADRGGARRAGPGRARGAGGRHRGADGGGRERVTRAARARGAAGRGRGERLLRLDEVEALQCLAMRLVVDACRHLVARPAHGGGAGTAPGPVRARPHAGRGWPGDAARELLVARAFGGKEADESHRARLRVEIGRLRRMLRPLAAIAATRRGFALVPRHAREVVVLAPPVDIEHAAVLALLADGEAWSSSALALALGVSQRTVQRALDALAAAARCSRSAAAARAAGSPRPCRVSRQCCYSPHRCPSD